MMWWQVLLTLVVAGSVGYLLFRLKVPGGLMVGAIVGVAALSILTGNAAMPGVAKLAAQIAAGAFIGCSVEKSDILRLRHILRPAAILLVAMLVLNLVAGFLIYLLSPLDLLTSLLCAVPGGMSDIPLVAADMGADAPKVTVLQFVRLVVGVGLFPSFITAFDRRFGDAADSSSAPEPPRVQMKSRNKGLDFALTLAIAAVGGGVGQLLGIPAGVLVFSMVAVIAFKLTMNRAYLPLWVKRCAQLLSGAYVGSSFTRADLLELRFLVVPAVIVVVGYALNCVLTGQLLHRVCHIPLKEAMLTATPAGATDMALISSDIGVQSSDLIVLQIIRMVVVIALFPQIIRLVISLC